MYSAEQEEPEATESAVPVIGEQPSTAMDVPRPATAAELAVAPTTELMSSDEDDEMEDSEEGSEFQQGNGRRRRGEHARVMRCASAVFRRKAVH